MKLRKYIEYIKEGNQDDFNFVIGEIVSVVGVVDDREFNGVEARIMEIDKDMYLETNMDNNGQCDPYESKGGYYIKPLEPTDYNGDNDEWWVTGYNLRHISVPDSKPGKIKWYKKGKFVQERMINESVEYSVGDEVIVNGTVDGREFRNTKASITKIHPKNKDYRYQIYILNGINVGLLWNVSEIHLKPTVNITPKTRWYKNGKFVQD